MAQITITVPDATVPRIRAAFGTGGNPATIAELQDAIKALIRDKVIAVEASAAAATDLASRQAESW